MSRWGLPFLILLLSGCEESFYGTADLYVYNGTKVRRLVRMEGGEQPVEFLLRSGTGKLLRRELAGDRSFTLESEEGTVTVLATLEKETFNVLNIGGAGCFARADVSGMYLDGRRPVKLSETFTGENMISMRSVVHVAPGERLPSAKPKSALTFNRLAVVPCDDLEDDHALAEYIKELR